MTQLRHKLFDLLNGHELEKVRATEIRNCYIDDLLVSELTELKKCLNIQLSFINQYIDTSAALACEEIYVRARQKEEGRGE